jgi:3-dehydroquinate dehydratase/shikimate dehydrogenase
MARICETVTATTMAAMRSGRDRSTAELVELRLDGVTDLDVAAALADRKKPVIVTCRPVWEGGAFAGSEETRLRLLAQAIALGAEYVDVEWRADRSGLPTNPRTEIVLSHHVFDGMPADLESRVSAMRTDAAGGVIKVAAATRTLTDCVNLRRLTSGSDRQIVIGMGAAGVISRVCPWLFGSLWTYGGTAADGQMPVADLADCLRGRRATSATAIYAITGAPLAHSASPAIQNAAFAAGGVDAVFVRMETADAAEFLSAAEAFGVAGASVTAPLKTAWAPLGVRLDAAAQAIGAVNTLRKAPNGWDGRNFDVDGFLAPLSRRSLQLKGQRVVVLGAGGAARGVAWMLKQQGAHVEIAARRPESAARLAAELGVTAVPWPPSPGWDMLVNATPVGTSPRVDATPLEPHSIQGGLVYDLVYNPAETQLLRLARAAGAGTIGGIEMLVAQAQAQFAYWIGRAAPDDVMERAAAEFVRRRMEK